MTLNPPHPSNTQTKTGTRPNFHKAIQSDSQIGVLSQELVHIFNFVLIN